MFLFNNIGISIKKTFEDLEPFVCKKNKFSDHDVSTGVASFHNHFGRALFRRIILMIHKNSAAAGNVHCGRSEATNHPQSPTQQGLLGSVRPTNGLCAFKSSTVVNGCLSATVWLRRNGDGTIINILLLSYRCTNSWGPPVESEPGTCHRKFKWKCTFLLCTICLLRSTFEQL